MSNNNEHNGEDLFNKCRDLEINKSEYINSIKHEKLKQSLRQQAKPAQDSSFNQQNINLQCFDDNDFIITEDNLDNCIADNLQSLDMKKYSDRNSYFNNSIRVFNTSKNKTLESENENSQIVSQRSNQRQTEKSTSSFKNFNVNYDVNLEKQQTQGLQFEVKQSIDITNESRKSNKQSQFPLDLKQNITNNIFNESQITQKEQTINSFSNNINIISCNSSQKINNIKQYDQSQNQQSNNKIIQNFQTETNIQQKCKQVENKQNQADSLKSVQKIDNKNIESQSNILNHQDKQNIDQIINQSSFLVQTSYQKSDLIQLQDKQQNIKRGRNLQIQVNEKLEDISPSPPNKKQLDLQNEQKTRLFYVSNNNIDIYESNRLKANSINYQDINIEKQQFPTKIQEINIENKLIEFEADDNNESCQINDSHFEEQNIQEVSFDQNNIDQSQIQRHSIRNSNLNIFVVKKNTISPTYSTRELKQNSKNNFFNNLSDDQKYFYENDSTKNYSASNVQLFSDLEPLKTAHFNKNYHNPNVSDDESYNLSFFGQVKKDEPNRSTDSEEFKEISVILKHTEKEDIKSFPQTPVYVTDHQTLFFRNQHDIIKSIFLNDLNLLKKQLQGYSNQQKNTTDINGNTLLYISTKLSLDDDKYYNLFKYLIQNGANPKIRNKDGWSPLDEAINAKNVRLTTTLFEYIYQAKKKKVSEQFFRLDKILPTLPDYYIEIKWHFESLIPFLGYFAPSDTFKFWKVGNSFRLDTTLVGFSNLKCKRRNMSLIFKNQQIYLINKSNKTITDPQEQLDIEEKKKIIQDLLESKPFQNTIDVTSCTVQQQKTWNGKVVKKKIANYNSEQYIMKLSYQQQLKNKQLISEHIYQNYDNYLDSIKKDQIPIENQPSKTPVLTKQKSNSSNNSSDKETKKATFNIWMSKEYPIHFKVLERSNPMLQKLNEFFNKEVNKQQDGIFVQYLFIQNSKLKIQSLMKDSQLKYRFLSVIQQKVLLISQILRFFDNFDKLFQINRFLDSTSPELSNLFDINKEFEVVPRKIAQKTLTRAKKRMIIANMITA